MTVNQVDHVTQHLADHLMDDYMNDQIEHLAGLLQQEIDAYSRLLEIEREKEKAIIANNAEGLLEVLALEEPAAAEAAALEQEILCCRGGIAEAAGKPGVTLREVIAMLSAPHSGELERLRSRLFGLAEEIRKVNQTNYLLLKQSIELLDEVLSAVLGAAPPVNMYEQNGRVECAPANRETVSLKA